MLYFISSKRSLKAISEHGSVLVPVPCPLPVWTMFPSSWNHIINLHVALQAWHRAHISSNHFYWLRAALSEGREQHLALGHCILLGCADNAAFPGALQCCATAPCRLCTASTAPSSFFNNPQAVPSPKAPNLGYSQCCCPQCCCISYTDWGRTEPGILCALRFSVTFLFNPWEVVWEGHLVDCWHLSNFFFILAVKWMSSRQLQTQFGAFRLEQLGHGQVQNADRHMAGKVCALDWEI